MADPAPADPLSFPTSDKSCNRGGNRTKAPRKARTVIGVVNAPNPMPAPIDLVDSTDTDHDPLPSKWISSEFDRRLEPNSRDLLTNLAIISTNQNMLSLKKTVDHLSTAWIAMSDYSVLGIMQRRSGLGCEGAVNTFLQMIADLQLALKCAQ